MSWLEVAMLVCFGVSWPFNILKTWTRKSAEGKSFLFLILIFAGYVCGVLNKLLGSMDWVVWVWTLNLVLVGIDLALATFYHCREKQQIGNELMSNEQ